MLLSHIPNLTCRTDGDGRFGPNDFVTREQMVAILWRYAKHKGIDVAKYESTDLQPFGDFADVAGYAGNAMKWACGSGLITGKVSSDGSGLILDPNGTGTRTQIATIMMRFCTLVQG